MKGLPASGKTTWARNWVNEKPKKRVRVSRDDIRKMLGPYWIPQREDLVTEIENKMVEAAANQGYSAVIDATNFRGHKRFLKIYTKSWHRDVIDFQIKDMTDVPLKTCIQRDQQRSGDDYVGKGPIMRMYNKYLKDD